MAAAKEVKLESGPAVGEPSPNERRALGELVDAPFSVAAHEIGFTLSLGDEHNGRAATALPLTVRPPPQHAAARARAAARPGGAL